VHLWFGNILGKYQKLEWDPLDKDHPVTAALRQRAKAVNFGAPGGLGPATLVAYAMNYGVMLTLAEAQELIELWFEHFPEMRDHLQSDVDELWTRRNIKIFLNHHKIDAPQVATLQELADVLRSLDWEEDAVKLGLRNLSVYQSRTVTGRLKRNCTFCSAANLRFQGPSADGAKIALWEGYLRGWRMVNFLHDEIIQELLLTLKGEQLMRFVQSVEQVMIQSMQRVLPHMKIKVDSALMLRWYKEAKPCKDADGYPTIWMPKEQNVADQLKTLAA